PPRRHARGAEAAGAARRRARPRRLHEHHPLDPLHHQLGDALAARHGERLGPEVGEQHLHLAAVVAVDGAGAVEHGHAVAQRQPRARAHLGLEALWQLQHEPGRHQGTRAGLQAQGRSPRQRRQQVEPGGAFRLVGGQVEAATVREPDDSDGNGLSARLAAPGIPAPHVAAVISASRSAARATSRRATSPLSSSGQLSTPCAVTMCTVLRSPPMTPVEGDTSLATIQSAPLALRLALAYSTTFSVSAANPITSGGRTPCGSAAMVLRMSGFSTSSSVGAALAPFLIFCDACPATRQSATAAANTPISAGRAARTAASMSSAVSTRTTLTPGGSARLTGPHTSVTSAPSARASAAIATPCLPDERLAM